MKTLGFSTASALALLLLGWPTAAREAPLPSNEDAEVEQLIDQLVNFGKVTTGVHPTAWESQFMAIDEEPQFGGGILGSEKPAVNPAMKKLVQLGIRALPGLINHLSDTRDTKLVEEHPDGFGAIWFSDEYSPRYDDPGRMPRSVHGAGLHAKKQGVPTGKYTFRVGDMCFVAIGQIVNRNLFALRYQPTNCEVINSPIQNPNLAAAVAKDWGALTPEAHEKQLEADALGDSSSEAAKRLLFYYPTDGERVAVRLLNREFYDENALRELAEFRMLRTDDEAQWRKLFREAMDRFGSEPASIIVPRLVYYLYTSPWISLEKGEKTRAGRILSALFPTYKPHAELFVNLSDIFEQAHLVRALACFPNVKIDSAVEYLFRRATKRVAMPASSPEDADNLRYGLENLAKACADRMAGKGFTSEYLSYFERRVREIEETPKDSSAHRRLDRIRAWLKKLGR